MSRTPIYRTYANTIRLDKLWFDYNEFKEDLSMSLAVIPNFSQVKPEEVLSEAQYKWIMRVYGDFFTAYLDSIQGGLDATGKLIDCWNIYKKKDNFYNMTVQELNDLNNASVSDYMGGYSDSGKATDESNMGLASKRVMNTKNVALALEQTTWKNPWLDMIKEWLQDIIEVVQEPQRELPKERR